VAPRRCAVVAALALICAALLAATGAAAAPTELTVRIEGKDKTLFEGPILSDGHAVQAAGDAEPRTCDGTNNSAHPSPGPTPTASSVDAMEMIGQTFGATWSAGFDDYFIERWGPDEEDLGAGQFWGVLVNGLLTPVGGCQWADQAGDEVLWAYDAFSGRRLLWLAAASDPAVAPGRPLPSAQVEVGQPLALEVEGYIGPEGESAEVHPAAGVTVGPVDTDPVTGFETVEIGAATAVTTAADGSATVTFASPGWHRIKAQREAGFIRSNRLDVCVEPAGGGNCGPPPADAALRAPARYRPPEGSGGGSGGPATPGPRPPQASPSNVTQGASLGAIRIDPGNGVARLTAVVPGPGRLALSGLRVLRRSVDAQSAGTLTVPIRPTPMARKTLRERGRLRVAVTVSFTPVGGVAATARRTLTLRTATVG
jgi:hypothetical protein